ncbi:MULTISPECIES: HAD-IIIA family hydrolase [Acidiplasma]|jgi:histidinol-phosphate phosphatase family protein|uniref:D,D-heptose 1,7-bisphosphate phosphatase n=1 Tax=Acidiplasma aeolicum TaxID=507754 RepID=A0A0Q0VPQ0_9ARCH|nr:MULTISPECIES: HAD family hydrolase [Acidiplasma]KJE49881.1 D,D-heptose 1,7-bisphosphate phosphatase [Acidiplasma sp. MBA-1]KQB35680.1 D,D-heptose 1,7-bisphosphate phosphatase [Acidiplasma aeolicum]WMT55051.1 MAG: HAD family hydrolase [Acidiplasma sp.]
MKPAIFLDRDGTINYDAGYTYKLEDLKIYDDIIPILKKYYDSGYIIIVISNQSGINRGYFTVNDMKKFNDGIKRIFMEHGIVISDFYFCPHKPEENCECRKPKTGMVEQAVKKYGIDLKNSIVIGDRDDIDGELARNLGIKFIKVHGYSAP